MNTLRLTPIRKSIRTWTRCRWMMPKISHWQLMNGVVLWLDVRYRQYTLLHSFVFSVQMKCSKIRREHLILSKDEKTVTVTLPFRKTHKNGGECSSVPLPPIILCFLIDILRNQALCVTHVALMQKATSVLFAHWRIGFETAKSRLDTFSPNGLQRQAFC